MGDDGNYLTGVRRRSQTSHRRFRYNLDLATVKLEQINSNQKTTLTSEIGGQL